MNFKALKLRSRSEEEGGNNDAGGGGEGSSTDEFEVSVLDVSSGTSDSASGSPDGLSVASFEVEISISGFEERECELVSSVVAGISSPSCESVNCVLKCNIGVSGCVCSN